MTIRQFKLVWKMALFPVLQTHSLSGLMAGASSLLRVLAHMSCRLCTPRQQ